MSKRSKTLLVIASVYCFIFAGLLVYGVYILSAEGAKLEMTKTQISEHTAKEAAYAKMISLLESTKENRAALQQFFITENDTITFLANIEAAAKEIGVELKTNELAVVPTATNSGVVTPPILVVSFSFVGSESSVKKFLTVLEHIPFHATMPKVTLTSGASLETWTGVVQLRLTIQP